MTSPRPSRPAALRIALGCVSAVPERATAVEERLRGSELTPEAVAAAVAGPRRDDRPALRRARRRPTTAAHLIEVSRRPRRARSVRASEGVSVTEPQHRAARSRSRSTATTYEREVEARRLLVHLIRDDLDLTGTHIGCDTGSCGACTVHSTARASRAACCSPSRPTAPRSTTVEGLAADDELTRAAAVVLGPPRAAVRLLHAGDADERHRAARARTRTRPSTRSRRRCRATSAAAPATGTSSRPCRSAAEEVRTMTRPRRPTETTHGRRHRHERPAQGGPPARPGPGRLRRRHQAPRHGLRALRALALRARARSSRSTSPRRSRLPGVYRHADRRRGRDPDRPVLPDRRAARAATSRTTRSPSARRATWASRSSRSSPRRASWRATPPSSSRSSTSRSPSSSMRAPRSITDDAGDPRRDRQQRELATASTSGATSTRRSPRPTTSSDQRAALRPLQLDAARERTRRSSSTTAAPASGRCTATTSSRASPRS